jgi:hypothetical protein
MMMGHDSKQFLWEESDFNPLTRLWHKDSRSPILNHKLLEFIKIVEIAAIQVFGSVEHCQLHEEKIIELAKHTLGPMHQIP